MKQGVLVLFCCLTAFALGVIVTQERMPHAAKDLSAEETGAQRTESEAAGQADKPETSDADRLLWSEPAAGTVLSPVEPSYDERFRLPVLVDGRIESMTLHRLVLGAVLGEMPSSFPDEALKAQAVACRTYALRQYSHRKHEPAALCTDPGCCMNWIDPEVFAAQAGEEALQKVECAVRETDGLVVCYAGAPITATFFSGSGGRTEDAADVWGGEVPYLTAVDSPGEHTPYDSVTVELPTKDFVQTLSAANEMADFSAGCGTWLGEITRTNGGGVATVEIVGCIYTGVQLRRLFALRSTRFELEIGPETVVFTTHGFGHRVGLSQYGAEAMAENGAGYAEILLHYYSGTEILHASEVKK